MDKVEIVKEEVKEDDGKEEEEQETKKIELIDKQLKTMRSQNEFYD